MDDRYSLPPDIAAALERARLQVEALAQTADELQVVLPDAVGSALRDGLREEAAPISRRLAEVKGLSNQMIRRLERLETDLLAERHARIDDLALLVDLITGQWRSMNERLDRIERECSSRRRRGRRAPPGRLGLEPQRAVRRAGSARSATLARPPSRARSGRRARRQLARDRQAEPGSAVAGDEGPEQALAQLDRDAGAVVGDRDADRAVRLCQLELDPPAVGRPRNAFESRLSTIWSTRSPSETITGFARIATR